MSYEPLYQLTRGEMVESQHFGALAVADSDGNLLAWAGDPQFVTFSKGTSRGGGCD